MGNCLVTKLNVSVNNPGLEKFGVLTIHNPSSDDTYTSRTFFIKGTAPITITSDGENIMPYKNDGTNTAGTGTYVSELTYPAQAYSGDSRGFRIKAGATAEIRSKYDLTYIQGIAGHNDYINTSSLKYMTNLTYINHKLTGELSNLSGLTNLHTLQMHRANTDTGTAVTGNIESLSTLLNLTTFRCDYNIKVSGDISSIGNLINLTKMQFYGCNLITGSLEDFVAAQRLAGRTTCSSEDGFTIIIRNTNVSFGGEVIGPASPTSATELTWTADTITFNGTTVNA